MRVSTFRPLRHAVALLPMTLSAAHAAPPTTWEFEWCWSDPAPLCQTSTLLLDPVTRDFVWFDGTDPQPYTGTTQEFRGGTRLSDGWVFRVDRAIWGPDDEQLFTGQRKSSGCVFGVTHYSGSLTGGAILSGFFSACPVP